MGLIRDAAYEAVKDLMLIGGIGAMQGAADAAGSLGRHLRNRKKEKELNRQKKEAKKEEKELKKIEKANIKIEKEAKREEFMNKLQNPASLLSKYEHNYTALCSDKTGKRTYVFVASDNQIKYMTSGTLEDGIGLYNYDEEQIGSVVTEENETTESGLKKFSKVLKLKIGESQIGTVEVAVTDSTRSIKLSSYFWNVWLKAGDLTAEEDNHFKMSPLISLSKKVYQISYNDPGKEVVLALTFIGMNEAKQILKDIKL